VIDNVHKWEHVVYGQSNFIFILMACLPNHHESPLTVLEILWGLFAIPFTASDECLVPWSTIWEMHGSLNHCPA